MPQHAHVAELLAFERMLAELIAVFVDLPGERLQHEIEVVLRRLLAFLGFDRCGFAEISSIDGTVTMFCSVAVAGVEPMPIGPFPKQLEWYMKTMRAGQMMIMRSVRDDLPPEAIAEREYVERSGMRSHLSIPVRAGGRVFGAIGFAAFHNARDWPADLVGRIKTIGEVIAAAIERSRVEAELHRVRSDLWHADRAGSAGALTGSLAHELNQPLTAILSNAQAALRFLDRGGATDQEIREILESIVREDKRAGAVIRGLRAMLRREEVPRARVNLADAFDEVLTLMRGELDTQNVELETRFDESCAVLGDRTQIQQVALNLIKNALEAMHSRSHCTRRLQLAIRSGGTGRVSVSVCDSGVGIAADKLASIFQPFATSKAQGMGLGLSIVRAIVEAHGGDIDVKCNRDCGVTFTFSLPEDCRLRDEDDADPQAPSKPDERAAQISSAPVVWILDDDPAVRESLQRLLASAGFAVEAFASPRDFFRHSDRTRAGCLLLDVGLPEMSGPEFHVRLRERGISVPVVFLTGGSDLLTGIEAMKRGAVDYLLKPVDDHVLLQTVERALKRDALEQVRRRELSAVETRLMRLSARERQVMDFVVRGHLNKQIAAALGISEKTVKQHRGRVMDKMEARSVADLVRLSEVAEPVVGGQHLPS